MHRLYFYGWQRGVAQPGSALPWGGRGREFKSRRLDQHSDSPLLGSFLLLIGISHTIILAFN